MDETNAIVSNGSSSPGAEPNRREEHEQRLLESVHEALWQTQRLRYQEWFHFASDGYLLTDVQGMINEANFAAAKLLDARKEFILGKPLGLFITEESRRNFYRRLAHLTTSDSVEQWEARVCRPRGEPREVMLTAAAFADEQGQAIKLRWMLRDISAARQTERAWLAEKSLADCLMDAAEIFIFLVNEHGRILRCNSHVLTVSGYHAEDLHGCNWWQMLLPAEDRAAARQLLERARMESSGKNALLTLAPRQGKQRTAIWSARKLGDLFLLIGYDVTELHEVQRQALQAERLAAIGAMAAGLAHESRNALQRSQACLSLLGLRLQGQPESLELLGRIEKAQDDLRRLFDDVRARRTQSDACATYD
jgi:PAS domain S-box-containing protein